MTCTLEQFVEILKFVQQHHKFALYIISDEERFARKANFPLLDEHGFGIKYVDCSYDSRDGLIWLIKFREYNGTVALTATNHEFDKKFKFNDLYDWAMAYLKGEWKPSKEFYV